MAKIKISFCALKRGCSCTRMAVHMANFIAGGNKSVALVEPNNTKDPVFSTINTEPEENGTYIMNGVRYYPADIGIEPEEEIIIYDFGEINYLTDLSGMDKIYLCTEPSSSNYIGVMDYFSDVDLNCEILLLNPSKEQLSQFRNTGRKCTMIQGVKNKVCPYALATSATLFFRTKNMTPPVYHNDWDYDEVIFGYVPEEEPQKKTFGIPFIRSKKKKQIDDEKEKAEDKKGEEDSSKTAAAQEISDADAVVHVAENKKIDIVSRPFAGKSFVKVPVPIPAPIPVPAPEVTVSEQSIPTPAQVLVSTPKEQTPETVKESKEPVQVSDKEKETDSGPEPLKKKEKSGNFFKLAPKAKTKKQKEDPVPESREKEEPDAAETISEAKPVKTSAEVKPEERQKKKQKDAVKPEPSSKPEPEPGNEKEEEPKEDTAKEISKPLLPETTIKEEKKKENILTSLFTKRPEEKTKEKPVFTLPEIIKPETVKDTEKKPKSEKTKRKDFFGHMSVFVTELRHGCGSSYTAGSLASALSEIYDKEVALYHRAGTNLPDNDMISEAVTEDDIMHAYRMGIIVYDRGVLSELDDDAVKEMHRSDIRIMVCGSEESDIKRLAQFIHQEDDDAYDWLYVFNHVLTKKQERKVRDLMQDFDTMILPIHDYSNLPKELIKEWKKTISKHINTLR